MNKKNNQRYKNSNEKIETAFLSLILNHEYDDISISEICKQANINRSTFYSHYDDINDLILKIESRFANSVSSIFNFGERQSHEAFIEMFKFVKQNKYFYKAFLNIPYVTVAEKNTKILALSNLKEKITTNISSIELNYRAAFFGAGLKEICKLWIDRDCEESPEIMANIIKNEYTKRNLNDVFK